jgi:hypothetical protein
MSSSTGAAKLGSSGSATSASLGSGAAAIAATIAATKSSGFFTAPNIGMLVGLILFVGFYIGAIATMANFVGSQDNWNAVQPQINKVIGLSIAGMVGFTIASLLYFKQSPNMSIIFTIILSCMALTMSFIAVSVSAITKSS